MGETRDGENPGREQISALRLVFDPVDEADCSRAISVALSPESRPALVATCLAAGEHVDAAHACGHSEAVYDSCVGPKARAARL